MAPKLRKPKDKLKYEPGPRIDYKTTTFRLPTSLLKDLKTWVDESVDDSKDGSLNDLVRKVLEWGLEHKEVRK